MQKLNRIWKKIVCMTGIALFVLLLSACAEKDEILFQDVSEYGKEDISETKNYAEQSTETISQRICVDVAGAVNHPGVVELLRGARVYQAIEKAGGFSEEAAVSSINQAEILEDGQQLYVCTLEEQEQVQQKEGNLTDTQDDAKININRASAEELMTLPGIGQSKAEDILRYRDENGAFHQIEDIMNISGIKEAVFGKIKDKITV